MIRVLCYAAVFAATNALAAALPEASSLAVETPDPGIAALHDFVRAATVVDGYLGGVTLLVHDDRIVDTRAYGHRDLARRDPMTQDAIFRVYSMTKMVTAIAVLMLVEEEKVALDYPVGKHLPELAGQQVLAGGSAGAPELRAPLQPVTIRHLLTHTAGFAAGRSGDEAVAALLERADTHGARDLHGFVARLARVPLAADPGTRFGYDGAASEVLARVVEVVSGQEFDAFVRTRILEPLRMGDTGFEVPPSQRHRIADLTRMADDGRLMLDASRSAQRPGVRLHDYPSGAGGLYSTAHDWARLCRLLLDGGTLDGVKLLKPETVDTMLANQLTMLDPPVHQFSAAEGFGFGGYVVRDTVLRGEPGSVGQFGWSGAASTMFTIDRKQRLAVILLLQHLPREDLPTGVRDLPRIAARVRTLAYGALLP